MVETSSIHRDCIEEIISNIKTFIICLIHRVDVLISDIGTCAFKRGIRVHFNFSQSIGIASIFDLLKITETDGQGHRQKAEFQFSN